MTADLIFAAVGAAVGFAEPWIMAWFQVRRGRLRVDPRLAVAVFSGIGALAFVLLAVVLWSAPLPPLHFASSGFAGTAAGQAISALIAWMLWRRRRNRKPATQRAGYKARALLARLVDVMRDAARPRPVPAPGGAW